MKKIIILTAIGKDRPGIVAGVSKVLYETGCNIEDSSMNRLGNDFAMILMVRLPAKTSPQALDKKLQPLRKKLGLSITLRVLKTAELKDEKPANDISHMLSVYGSDKPGIVFQIAKFLAANKINITDVQTKIAHPKLNPVYIMMLEVDVPKTANLAKITRELADLAQKLEIDVNLKPIESYQL
jgi:glycine cleavage system transcriptional repressor